MSGPYGYIGPQMMPPPPPPSMATGMDPSSNNAPLQFNTSKGKPPMPIVNTGGPGPMKVPKDVGVGGGGPMNMDLTKGPDEMGAGVGTSMMAAGMMGMGPMPGPGSMPGYGYDPNMMMMMNPMQFGGYMPGGMGGMEGPYQANMQGSMTKEMITLKSCVLYPPPPGAPPPSTRERPPGCRTIFVGGLPENTTEEILREIFESCGEIYSIRISKKNFAHIRFMSTDSVDRALYISGYRMKVGDQDDKPNTGRLHVDYAQARDDQHEFECQQRAMAREHRHQQRIHEERLKPPSPPPVIHFSDHEAGNLMEALKGDEEFMRVSQMLMTWLERGDCNRRSANTFYSMIQSVHSHTRRLLNEKMAADSEYEEMKQKYTRIFDGILKQFEQIEKVFGVCTKQKAWDHFTKAQRKNIDMWKKQAKETANMQRQDIMKARHDEEMELSDDEETPIKKKKLETALPDQLGITKWQNEKLKEEVDSLKFQLEAYKNEVEIARSESKASSTDKDKQLKMLQSAMQGMQQQLMAAKNEIRESTDEMVRLKRRVRKESEGAKENGEMKEEAVDVDAGDDGLAINEKQARLIGLISTFLHVHPFGASVEYIASYLSQLAIKPRTSDIEDLLTNLPSVFRQDLTGVGATLERRWKFLGYDHSKY